MPGTIGFPACCRLEQITGTTCPSVKWSVKSRSRFERSAFRMNWRMQLHPLLLQVSKIFDTSFTIVIGWQYLDLMLWITEFFPILMGNVSKTASSLCRRNTGHWTWFTSLPCNCRCAFPTHLERVVQPLLFSRFPDHIPCLGRVRTRFYNSHAVVATLLALQR